MLFRSIYLTLARAWVVEEKWPEARRLLQRIWEVVGSSEVLERKLETLVLSALAERGNQNHKSSLEILETALMLAEPEGYLRVFLNENLVVMDLLRAIPPRSPARKYAQHILSEFVRAEAGKSLVAQSDLAEPLSEREVEILALLNSPLTTLEIAAQLILSKNTVRTHIKNIFAKLGVHGRSAAVKRARDLGLLK